MLSNNDINRILAAIADGYFLESMETTDDTPVTVRTYTMTGAEVIAVKVMCAAISIGAGAFVSNMTKTFYYDGATVTEGGLWGDVTKEYLGTGLSTCDFDFSISGADVSVVWTGEAGKDITVNFKIQVQRLVNTNLP
ncbi:MAG TPA: hypothetical protein VFT06_00255 [Flavisolibacter sp.]|nr:hypothetical protein [Flavisolibacter sp.]